ncbi:hypothetical protein B7494_g2138 [Chlorociboria aeruginascens]|nr:hypothetical protein B7494_g2138 [Chlorociboria aeruginascens]
MMESLNVIALISGGKDSFFSILHCMQNGHKIVALGNLHPPLPGSGSMREDDTSLPISSEEIEHDMNSFMYQTVGHTVIPLYEKALRIPLYRQPIIGTAIQTGTSYNHTQSRSSQVASESRAKGVEEDDETESLIPLLKRIVKNHPNANALSTGAILSTYQRTRIESVAIRLGLIPLSFLWKYPILPPGSQTSLLHDMQKPLSSVTKMIERAMNRFGTNGDGAVLGEGGEFETLVVDGPSDLFKGRIDIRDEDRKIVREGGGSAWLHIKIATVVMKDTDLGTRKACRVPDLLENKFGGNLAALLDDEGLVELPPWNANPASQLPSPNFWSLKSTSFPTGLGDIETWTIVATDQDEGLPISKEASILTTEIRERLVRGSMETTDIVATIIVLRSMADFVAVNKAYGSLFTQPNPPSRVTISCGDSMPHNKNIIIHVKIQRPGTSSSSRKALHVQSRSYWAPANIGPYSQATSIPLIDTSNDQERIRTVEVAGQIALIPHTMILPRNEVGEGINQDGNMPLSDYKLQTVLALQHLWRIGIEMDVQWWTSAVAYLPHGPRSTISMKARIAGRSWSLLHNAEIEDEGDESGGEKDLWDEKYNFGMQRRGVQDRRSAEVEELPRGSAIEWHAHLGVANGAVKPQTDFFYLFRCEVLLFVGFLFSGLHFLLNLLLPYATIRTGHSLYKDWDGFLVVSDSTRFLLTDLNCTMAVLNLVPDRWLVGLCVIILLSTAALLVGSKRQRETIFDRLHLRRRRTSGASTPPRCFSPATKQLADRKDPIPLSLSTPDHVQVFPPSRRSVLPELAKTASTANKKILTGTQLSFDCFLENTLPTSRPYDLEDGTPKYTPTGFSTTEIKAMGDFPAYDILSGVPLPEPYKDFDPLRALPRPYRPFRWEYHQTMSHNKMEADWWLEVENTYVSRIKERKDLFYQYGKMVLDHLPGSELACKELMEMSLQFYCARYPTCFSLSEDKKIFHNSLLKEDTDIKSMHPLNVLLNNVPEDFAIVLRNEADGMYYFRAGVICSSLGWNVSTKIGMNLRDIHQPIPDYKEKMSRSMDRYFSRLATDAPIQRGSWGLEIGTPLFMPPGHPHEKYRACQKDDLKIEECNLRVDWQTLRRLPLSAGVVFNFTALFTPIQELRDEPYIPALLLKILKEGKKNLMEYKNTWHVEHVCVPELEKYAIEQVDKGLFVASSSLTASGSKEGDTLAMHRVATQACETCRSRKQKCDEQRPKCGHCHRMKLECSYREPQPTKKDKTLVEILERVKSMELKVDQIASRAAIPSGFGPPQTSPSSQPSFRVDIEDPRSRSASSSRRLPQQLVTGRGQPYRHASAAHRMLTWPAIQQLLLQAVPSNTGDLNSLEQEGSAFIIRMQKGIPNLPLDEILQGRPFVGMQSQATREAGATRITFPLLTRETMHRLATAYFDTFNLLYPFMDRQNFISDTLSQVDTEGFNGDTDSVIALLVFALGELALEGYDGQPIEVVNGRSSGVRGGSSSKPPGLALFNEARRRMGFVLTECDLENVQIFSLAACVVSSFANVRLGEEKMGSCNRQLGFITNHVLVTCNPIDWNSPRGDLVKRAFWHCVLMETGLHLEIDLPPTGIIDLEGRVGLPTFNSPFCESDDRGNQTSHFEAHYASQLALRRLLKVLASQLIEWRSMLPRQLQWPEDNPTVFPTGHNDTHVFQQLDPDLSPHSESSNIPLFIPDLNCDPARYEYLYDIQVALLRTRYYYAKYVVYRPFVYKALHFPDQMTQEDAEGVAECLRSCINWPLTLSPASRRKRLIPYLFCWSQNLLGILIIIHMTRHNPMLRDIRSQLCGPKFEGEIDQTVELMLDWIKDLKGIDPIAMWCWKIISGLYPNA